MNRSNTLVPIIAFAMLAVAFSSYAEDAIKLRGIVSDAITKVPLDGAIVSASGNVGRYDAVSDSKGFFSLPLTSQVKAGHLIRLRVEKRGYLPHDENIAASNETILQFRLQPEQNEISAPEISEIIFLESSDVSRTEIELHISNPSSKFIWLKRLNFNGEVALTAHGATSFIRRIDYQINLNSIVQGRIAGKAKPANLTGSPYPVKGYYRFVTDTGRGIRAWQIGFGAPLPVRIDAGDKVALRLILVDPKLSVLETESEGEFRGMYVGGIIRKSFSFSVITDDGKVASIITDDHRLLKWISDNLPR